MPLQQYVKKEDAISILAKIKSDEVLLKMWERFSETNYFVGELNWEQVIQRNVEFIENSIFG